MKFPSLNILWVQLREALIRFPFVILSAIAAVVMTWVVIGRIETSLSIHHGVLFAGYLGISFLTACALFGEAWKGRSASYILQGCGLLLLILYALLTGADVRDPDVVYRFALLFLASHLAVSIAPYLGKASIEAFWNFNKQLLLRMLTGILFSGVLSAGLALSLLAVDNLLIRNDDLPYTIYPRLIVIVCVLFNTLFVLGGIPKQPRTALSDLQFPKGLRVFAANLLLPLVGLYMLILYVYAISILIEWEWPQGWIGWLVLSFSVVGMLAFLLLYPLRNDSEHRWVGRASRWFYLGIIPLVFLLYSAIFRRISEYGITENRYFVIGLAIWLSCMVLYFLISRKQDIRIVPASLILLITIACYGPLSAFAISTNSQLARIERLLTKHGALVDGHIDQEKGMMIEGEDQGAIESIVEYLGQRYELDRLGDLLGIPIEDGEEATWEDEQKILAALGLRSPVPDESDLVQVPEGLPTNPDDTVPGEVAELKGGFEPAVRPEIDPDAGEIYLAQERRRVKGYDIRRYGIYFPGITYERIDNSGLGKVIGQTGVGGRIYDVYANGGMNEITVRSEGRTIARFEPGEAILQRLERRRVVGVDGERLRRVGVVIEPEEVASIQASEGIGEMIIEDLSARYSMDEVVDGKKPLLTLQISTMKFSLLLSDNQLSDNQKGR